MNSTDKKRVESLLRTKGDLILGISRDKYGWNYHERDLGPTIEKPKALITEAKKAYRAAQPTEAQVKRLDDARKALANAQFEISFARQGEEPHVYPMRDNAALRDAYKAQEARKLSVDTAIETAIIELWSSDDFDLQGFLDTITEAAK